MRASTVSALPEIPGLPDLSKPPPSPPGQPGPWRVRLENVVVTKIRSVWLDAARLTGESEVHGGFELRPGRGAGVLPARFIVHEGKLTLRGAPAASLDHASVEGKIASFDKAKARGLDLFAYVTGKVAFEGRIEDVGFLNRYVEKVKWLGFEGGGGPVKADLRAEKGELLPGSHLEVSSHDIHVSLWRQEAIGDARVRWRVEKGKPPKGTLNVLFENYRLEHKRAREARIEGRALEIDITTPELDLTHPFEKRRVRIEVPRANITDCRYFNSYLPRGSGFRISGGNGTIHGRLLASTEPTDEDKGEIQIEVPIVSADFESYRMKGHVSAKVLLNHGNIDTGKFDLLGTSIDLSDIQGALVGAKPDPENAGWWGNILVSRGSMYLGEGPGVDTEISLRGRDARPVFALFAAKGELPGWVAKILSFQNLSGRFRLELRDDLLAVHDGEIKGDNMALLGWLRKSEEHRDGRLLLELGPLAAGLTVDDKGAHVRMNDAVNWYHLQRETNQ